MKKNLKIINLILFLALVSIKLLVYGKMINPYFKAMPLLPPIIGVLLIISSFSLLFKDKGSYKYLSIWNTFISILLIADINYYRYYKDILSIPVLKNGILLGDVNNAVKSLIQPKDLLLVADIVLISGFKTFNKLFKKFKFDNLTALKHTSIKKRLVTFAGVFIIGISINSYCIHALNVQQPGLIRGMYNKIYICEALGNLNCHALDLNNFIKNNISNLKPVEQSVQNDIKEYFAENSKLDSENFKGIAQGKNLLLVQVEALQGFVINKKIEGQEITPNLNRWLKKCMYFDNYYYQVAGGNTSDAEFMTNNSLYPASAGAAYYMYSGDTLNSLSSALKKDGYYSAALHPYKAGFWNRNVMYKQEGFDNFFNENNYNIDEKIGLGLSDESFLKQSLEKMKDFKSPYYSFIITLTSHFPFEAVDKYGEFNVGEYEGTFLGNYLKAIHYTDKQLGMFLDELEKNGTLDKSILVLYGDHFAISKNYSKQLYSFVGESEDSELNWMKYQKVPMLIHFPNDANKGVNHTTSGQMDIYPTLANMFNIDNKYMFGRDIFNKKDRLVVFRSGSFTDGTTFYSSSTNKYYDMKTGEVISESIDLAAKKQNARKQLDYSDTILNHNLLKDFLK